MIYNRFPSGFSGSSLAVALMMAGQAATAAPPSPQERWEAAVSSKDEKELLKIFETLPKDERIKVLREFAYNTKVYNGKPAEIANYPWQVAFVHANIAEPSRSLHCGGALIAPKIVITAAHCVDHPAIRFEARNINIVAGTTAFGLSGERLAVRAVHVHPKWNKSTMDFDVAILKLETPSQLGRPITLARSGTPVGTTVRVTGWGATETSWKSDKLLYADVPIVDRTICNAPKSYNGAITQSMICAGYAQGKTDSCNGDSGGPLAANPGGLARLVGVVSWGVGCAEPNKYGVYTDVTAVLDWADSFLN